MRSDRGVLAVNVVLVDLADARSAVQEAAKQVSELVRSLPDPQAFVPGLDWTVGQTAAHLVAAAVNYPRFATGLATPEDTIDLREGNLERIRQVGRHDLTELADLLVEETDRYLERTADLSADHRVPFFGGVMVSLAAQTGILLGEYVIHGHDLARAAGKPWRIDPSHAVVVIGAAATVLPRYLDLEAARGVRVAYDIRIRGGPRFVFRVADDAAAVELGADGPVDCRISADPVAFLLVAYGRQAQWRPVLQGRMTAWGRRPWRAFALKRLLVNP
jgi:uncharacterized protein (TIGR03083 family)